MEQIVEIHSHSQLSHSHCWVKHSSRLSLCRTTHGFLGKNIKDVCNFKTLSNVGESAEPARFLYL